MKTKKIVSLLLSVMIFTLSSVSAVFVQADGEVIGENYSSEIPASLKLEILSGAYRSQWQVYNSQKGGAKYDERSLLETSTKNLKKTTGIDCGVKAVSWTEADGAINVGKFKNTYLAAPFKKSGIETYSAFDYLGAGGIGLKNSDASSGGFAAVIAKLKLDYTKSTAPQWGGYSSNYIKDINQNDIMAGYSSNPTLNGALYYGNDLGIGVNTYDKSYLAVGLMAESNVDLGNTYITVLTTKVAGYTSDAARAVTGVPISRYYSEADKGTYKEIAIPLADFDISNDWVVSKFICTDGSVAEADYPSKPQTTFTNTIGAGLMKVYEEGVQDVTENHMVYITKTQFLNVAAPSNAATEKVSGDSTGYYEKLTFTPSGDADVTAYEISLKDTSGNTLFTKTVPVSKFTPETDGKLSYVIGTVSPKGAVYSISAVCGEVVGNENIGYAPVKSGAVVANTKWDAGSSVNNPVYSMKYTVSGGNTVNVIGRVFYDCRVIVARYSSDGQVLVQSDMFNPLGDICRVTYDTAIGDDTIKVFIWSNDDSNTPLIGAAVTAGENVTR